ncbi:MAG: aspartate aminotransferase family protein [Bacteroidales bacterium]|nr:aspartate aminotransferase family protein [Bacteroidales bacterium]
MISQRQLFLNHIAQTSDFPLLLEIESAEGIYMYGTKGEKYTDLISGVSVSNIGHRHPSVVRAVKNQLDKYMHLMVYGEYIQSPQVNFAELLARHLPENLSNTYLVNSGSEAIEGALKLAKRYTGRSEVIAFNNAYHGSTHGALSVLGNEDFKNSFRPLVPGVKFLNFNNFNELEEISEKTACVLIEPVQGEGGIILPEPGYLQQVRERCTETGALLIFDEIQTGFGRIGSLFAFQQFNVVPDIMTIAKAMGGGMPIGAFVSSKEIMSVFKTNPILGHITTFGGHPVSAAAAFASLKTLIEEKIVEEVFHKENIFRKCLKHPEIKELRGRGLFLAVELENEDKVQNLIKELLKLGVIVDWFLFKSGAFRIAPPLIITDNEIREVCVKINKALDLI